MKKIKLQLVLLCIILLGFISCSTAKVGQGENEDRSEGIPGQKAEPDRRKSTGGSVLAINNPLPEGSINLIEDFEDGMFWYADGISEDSDYSIGTALETEWFTSGETSGTWSFARIPEGCAASFSCNNLPEKDFGEASFLLCDINNTSDEAVSLYAEFETGDTHEKSSTAPVLIGIGENINVMFDLKHGILDANANNVYEITDAADVRVISFKIQGKAKAASIGIDNIRVAR